MLALVGRQGVKHILDDLLGQIRRKVGDFIGVELLGRGNELLGVHALDEGFAYRIGYLEQDLPVTLRLDEIPNGQPLFIRQRFENIGDIRRVHFVELGAQLGEMLLGRHRLDLVVARHVLSLNQHLHQMLAPQ